MCESTHAKCPRIVCPECDTPSCFKCRQPWHGTRACKFETSDTIKPCPQCGVTIYKGIGDGCNAMQCSVCKYVLLRHCL